MRTKIPNIGFIDRLFFLTPQDGWIASVHGTYRTVNGGRDWKESRMAPQQPERVRDLFFLDRQRGWVILWNQGGGTSLYSTVDGGEHWTPDLAFQGRGKLATVVRFTSKEKGFVVVDGADIGRQALMYTSDGGAHWSQQTLSRFIGGCQVFEGDLLCSVAPGFHILTVHPK